MSPAVWYFARSAGIVAYLLLTGSVLVGLLMSGRVSLSWPRFAVEELHRFLAILTGVFVVLHGGQLLVPFTSPYRPLAVGLGVTAAELMAAVGVTNLLRGRMPRIVWRRVHYLTLAVWALASLHGVLAGSDRGDPWFAGIVTAAATAVALAFAVRVRSSLAAAAAP